MSYEIRDCDKGEVNAITKEFWCNAYQEFCTEITDCALKILNKQNKSNV